MRVNPVVFFVSAGVILLFVLFGAGFHDRMESVFGAVQDFIVIKLGWFYILSVAVFLLFVIWLYFSRYGSIRLGRDDDEPEYSRMSWFAMLFSAGMGIGLLFFSVAEPIHHFANPRNADPRTIEAARQAFDITIFHWGIHAWAIYIIVGLSLSYFTYRRNLPLQIRSGLYPLLGKRINGIWGDSVEIMAVFGTLFGVASSLGFGAKQINAGLAYLGLMEVSSHNQLFLIAGITVVATVSVVSGLDVGIRRLSELNLGAGFLLLALVFLLGPTTFLLRSIVQTTGSYLSHLVSMTFQTDAYAGAEWQKSWTTFYWGWWISWSPFVGMFIARISKGRTIREFILGASLVPTALTIIWMVVFGGSAVHYELHGDPGIISSVQRSIPTGLFVLLEQLPGASLTAGLATVVIATYFVTSSDSASLVIDMLTSGGNPNPPIWQRIFWALSEGAVGAVLLVTGGLTALRTAAVTTAFPFCGVMLAICWSLAKGLRRDRDHLQSKEKRTEEPISAAVVNVTPDPATGVLIQQPDTDETLQNEENKNWKDRLQELVASSQQQPARLNIKEARERLEQFVANDVMPAFEKITAELKACGRDSRIDRRKHLVSLTVLDPAGKEEFSYAIRGHAYHRMRFAYPLVDAEHDHPEIYRAEVVLPSGPGEEHNIGRWSHNGIIEDFLREYEQWLAWNAGGGDDSNPAAT